MEYLANEKCAHTHINVLYVIECREKTDDHVLVCFCSMHKKKRKKTIIPLEWKVNNESNASMFDSVLPWKKR